MDDRTARIIEQIDAEISEQREIAAGTQLENLYRHTAGRIEGLERAKRIILAMED